MSEAILLIHAFATCALVGLIWFVQVVHYPLMAAVPPERFSAFALAHQRRTTGVVGPLMLAEAATCVLIALGATPGVNAFARFAGAAALSLVWMSTFLVQVPLHARLAQRFDARDHARLVASNWVRTVLWTARGVIAALLLG